MAKVYYIGDWAVQLGPVYAETPFNHSPKDKAAMVQPPCTPVYRAKV